MANVIRTQISREANNALFISLSNRLRISRLEDWHSITPDVIRSNGGGELLDHYRNSINDMLADLRPEHPRRADSFRVKSRRSWKETSRQREFFDLFGKKLGVKRFEDWYQVKNYTETLRECGGIAFLNNEYGGSLQRALKSIYPDFNWQFENKPSKSSEQMDLVRNQREIVDHIAQKLNIKEPEDWYLITSSQFDDVISDEVQTQSFLRNVFGGSIYKMLSNVYPEHTWEPLKFQTHGKWSSEENLKRFILELEQEIGIRSYEDWVEALLTKAIRINSKPRLSSLLQRYNGFVGLLSTVYPKFPWHARLVPTLTSTSPITNQKLLFDMIRSIIPRRLDIHFNFLHPGLQYSNTKRTMELDVFIPEIQLAFEYQGIQHFDPPSNFTSSPRQRDQIIRRDAEKRRACSALNIILVEIPHWWDGSLSSLIATVRKKAPIVKLQFDSSITKSVQDSGCPIPESPPNINR